MSIQSSSSSVSYYNNENHCHHHNLRRQHEMDDDSSTMPLPALHRQGQCPPPIAPLPEPSYQTQVLLGEMFSERAVLRNYCADSIQAFMMALDEQRLLEQERQHEEDASLALARMLQQQEELHPHAHAHQQEETLQARKPKQRMSLISDLDICDLGSSSEDSSSLDIPDYFTTQEARRSHKSLLTFEQEIMPIPLCDDQKTIQKMKQAHNDDGDDSDDKKRSLSPPRIQRFLAKAALKAPPPPPGEEVAHCQPAAASAPPSKKDKTKSKKSTKKNKDRQCLICHRSTAECRLRMRKLSCGHQFCRSCIDRWLETKDSCPYCRQKVSEKTRQKVRRQNSVGAASA